jgi:peptidoglycan hydrolase-like protein with peptidoglycan-binding domain
MRRAALALLAATGTLWATASAAMDSETPTVTLRLSVPSVAYGDDVTARGRVSLEGTGRTVVLEQRRGSAWRRVAVTRTDATGAFTAAFAPRLSGAVRARLAERGAASPAASLRVRPVVRVGTQPGRAFLGAALRLRIRPAAWSGTVTVRVARGGRLLAIERKQVAGGSARVQIPTPGVGRFRVRLVLGASESYERVRALGSVEANATPLAYGSTGPEVRALLGRLEELRYHVPAERDVFGPEALDAVLAFQKAEGLTRDGAVGEDVWAALGRARPPKPRFRRPALHIEVDKTRQILMVVREGKVESVVSVSTGATGNTPEGAFRILWKAPATTTWLGPAILYRTMTFLGNEFAIHGFPEVPAYAASHGCVRVPMWLADWLYQRSPVGERIFIYR